ncbi:hypothetical protein QUF58_08675 [Anaerolineales bacterium HSG24]|nr:hypothetical protein [Anaerolineales bacterium HSG24]
MSELENYTNLARIAHPEISIPSHDTAIAQIDKQPHRFITDEAVLIAYSEMELTSEVSGLLFL